MAVKLGKGGGLDSLSSVAKVAIGLLFAVMVAAGYFVVFYSEIDGEIAKQRQMLVAKKRDLVEAEKAKEEYNRDLAEKARREQLADRQKKILPDQAETPSFLDSIQTVATIAGVGLVSWAPLEEVQAEFYSKVPMKLKLDGRYHQIAKFFNGVGQIDRIINMEDIHITVARSARLRRKEAVKKRNAAALVGVDESTPVEVDCLATAFRARSADSKGRASRGGRRRRGGRK